MKLNHGTIYLFEKRLSDFQIAVPYIKYITKNLNYLFRFGSVLVIGNLARYLLNPPQESISNILSLDMKNIGITATSGEGLTSFGKGEGIQVLSIVTAVKK